MWWPFAERRKKEQDLKERVKALRALILKPSGNDREVAIGYCEWCIIDYEDLFEYNEWWWAFWQRGVIIGGVVATLAGVINFPPQWYASYGDLSSLSWLRGVPAAFLTIAAGLLSSFTYRQDMVRHELTKNALWNELAKYQGHAQPYDKKEERTNTSLFLNTICLIIEVELRDWSAIAGGRGDKTPDQEKPKDDSLPHA